jgi:hypothetical protein
MEGKEVRQSFWADSLPVFQLDWLLRPTRLGVTEVLRRYLVEKALHGIDMLLGAELLVELHGELLLGVLLC